MIKNDRLHTWFLALQAAVSVATGRRGRRLRALGLESRNTLPVADLDFRCNCQSVKCRPYVVASQHAVRLYRRPSTQKSRSPFFYTAAVIDLATYGDADSYERSVGKATNRKYNRAANKVQRLGYEARQIGREAHILSNLKIRRSKKFRSRGPVAEAFKPLAENISDTLQPVIVPDCPEHWRIDWGLFERGSEDMKAFASFQRSGNLVLILHMIGHAEILQSGGMKLLQFRTMSWLFSKEVPDVQGVRYVMHGAIEHGSTGLADWRRYVLQNPMLLRYPPEDNEPLPADFNLETYLELNPDLRSDPTTPREHFIWAGWLEGRRYRR